MSMLTNGRFQTVLIVAIACVAGFCYLWVNSGGAIPVIADRQSYQVSFVTSDTKNLLNDGDVRIAGVNIGNVLAIDSNRGHAKVTVGIDREAAPLHEGVKFRVGVKSLVGSSFLDIVDGKGEAIPAGTTLSSESVTPPVDVDELFDTLDPKTRAHLSAAIQSLGTAVDGRSEDLDQTMTGIGRVGQEGATVLDALANQSDDLRQVVAESKVIIDSLNTGNGEIVSLVSDAQRLTKVTAANQAQVEETVRLLPELVERLDTAAGSLEELSEPLAPIAEDLREASPDLSAALTDLGPTTNDLRRLLPSLHGVLTKAPATLERVPAFGNEVDDVLPQVRAVLADASPMLDYLGPYGLDLGVLFASFGACFDTVAEDGIRPIRLTPSAEGFGTIRGLPVPTISHKSGSMVWNNPYPKPNTVDAPAPFGSGPYPRIHAAK